MHGLGAGYFGCIENRGLIEVALCWRGRADAQGLICLFYVNGISVGFGVDRHCAQTQAAAGALDAQGDFAPVGDEHAVKHRLHSR